MKYALSLVLLLAACGEKVAVHVDCITTAAPAIECDVKETKGKAEIEACWDISVTCPNQAVVKAPHWCQKVKDGGTAHAVIPGDKLTGMEGCGGTGAPTAKLDNLTLDGHASTN